MRYRALDPERRAIYARERLVHFALDNSGDMEYRKLLGQEILSAAVETFSSTTRSSEVTAGALPKYLCTDELKKVVLSYLNASQTGSEALVVEMKQQLQDYCEREDVYCAYIQNYYGNQNGWFAFQRNCSGESNTSMIDITAKM